MKVTKEGTITIDKECIVHAKDFHFEGEASDDRSGLSLATELIEDRVIRAADLIISARALRASPVVPLVLALLLFPSIASAQARLTLPTLVYAGAVSLDIGSTADCLSVGCHERNPALNWLEPHGTAPMLTFGAGLSVAAYLTLTHAIAPQHPRLAKVVIYSAAIAHGLVGARNLQQARQQRACNLQVRGTRC